MNWWEDIDGRLDAELKRFDDLGLKYQDQTTDSDRGAGILRYEVIYHAKNGDMNLEVIFPPDYPFFKPKVIYQTEECLIRHHNPISKELCTLDRNGADWVPNMSAADLIQDQIKSLLQTVEDPLSEYTAENESQQGEPISSFYPRDEGYILLVEDIHIQDLYTHGAFTAARLVGDMGFSRFTFLSIEDNHSNVIANASDTLINNFQEVNAPTAKGYWRQWKTIPGHDQHIAPQAMKPEALCRAINKPKYEAFKRKKAKQPESMIFATLYEEEAEWRKYDIPAWYGVVVVNSNGNIKHNPLPAGGYDFENRFLRAPELRPLKDATVTISGAGMLGSSIAIQLARAGVGTLNIIDFDYIELPTTIRYALGAEFAHMPKAAALKLYILRNYPGVRVNHYVYGFGMFPSSSEDIAIYSKTRKSVMNAIEAADLLIEATVEKTVRHFLTYHNEKNSIPTLFVASRPGSWGGELLRVNPEGPCWNCFERYQKDPEHPFDVPNGDDSAEPVQGGGCGSPTSIGNGFDADEISLETVRTAVGILTSNDPAGYPDSEWNAVTINLRGEQGRIPIECKTYNLPIHPDCKHHG
ncbi:MAG: ThiF family adenylyltransferase [Neptuniibacter sp.]